VDWIVELLLALFSGPRREDRSVVGKSRIDSETSRFWTWIGVGAIAIAFLLWMIFRR
jgi:hypothetical protein